MASVTQDGWWQRARGALMAGDTPENRFAPDRLDAYSRELQSALPLFFAFLIAFALNLFMDGDTGWHLGAGHWVVEHRAVPTVDPFSHTMPGKAWMAHEWLAEVLMVGAEWLRGWAAITVLYAASAAFTFWLLAREAFRHLPARYAVTAVALAAGILFPFTLARPHMLAWSLLALWTVILLRAREERRAPPLAAALLMAIWANLHASYIVAFGLAGLFALESLIENPRDTRLLGRWAAFGLLALGIAVFATPFGPEHFLYPFEVSNMKALAVISEWRRSVLTRDIGFTALLVVMVGVVALRWRTVPPLRFLLLAGLAAMALLHARHQMLFAIVGLLVLMPMVDPATSPRRPLPRTAWFLPLLLLVFAARLAIPYQFKEHSSYPLTLLAKVPAELRAQPVYNEYSQGGPLVMIGVRPYIDGRADMYGDDFTFRAKAITAGDISKFREDVTRFGIRWAVLENTNGLTKKLLKEPGWRLFARDRHASIFVRTR
ncbi:hypothetical protein GCM10022281_14400 [Sphingomonas rosea]|uniref:Glycosyltransferase RgtA/B/C/D-like domain-containing protein n=1 Tax=Sphingomonas rosea TaxID=335605 RepID=A0ABP7U361_9SPHN